MARKTVEVTLEDLQGFIEKSIKTTVNGKIDRLQRCMEEHNTRHEADMQDIKPYLKAAHDIEGFVRIVKWSGGFFVSLGGMWLLFSQVFPNFNIHLW